MIGTKDFRGCFSLFVFAVLSIIHMNFISFYCCWPSFDANVYAISHFNQLSFKNYFISFNMSILWQFVANYF